MEMIYMLLAFASGVGTIGLLIASISFNNVAYCLGAIVCGFLTWLFFKTSWDY